MKAGLLSYSRLVADVYATAGIRCNAVTPGPTGTEAWLGEGGPRRSAGRSRGGARARCGRRPAARPSRRAGRDRRRDRLPAARSARRTSPAPPGACDGGTVPDHHLIRRYPGLDARARRESCRLFAARVRELEEAALSPLAVRSYDTRGRALDEEPCSRAHAVPARPRPHPALEAVPAAEGEDAGLHRPGRRPLPHAHDAHARDHGHRARRRPRAAAERGPDRGDRARPRHGPPAVRARRRGRARCRPPRPRPRRLPPQRAVGAHRAAPEPHARGGRRDRYPHGRRASPRRSRARSSGSSTASPTSTTTSTTRSATGSSREDDLPQR